MGSDGQFCADGPVNTALQSETMLLEAAILTESGRPILSHPGEVERLMQDKVPEKSYINGW